MRKPMHNFDEKSLQSLPTEPHATLHRIRAVLRRIKEIGESPATDGDAQMQEIRTDQSEQDAARAEAEIQLFNEVKMLVDSPLSVITLVPQSHTKDIFNALAERLSNFATYEREDRPIGNPEASEQEREAENAGRKTPRLALLLNALIILSTSGVVERVSDTEVLVKILKESEDPRVISHASKLLQFLPILSMRQHEIMEKVIHLATAPNLLRGAEHYFSLLEVYQQQKENGEKLLGSEFLFEVEKPALSLNERPTISTISINPSVILSLDKTATQLANDLAKEHVASTSSDSVSIRNKLIAKIIWFRYAWTHSREDSTKALLYCLNVAGGIKLDSIYKEACSYLRDSEKFLDESIQLFKNCKDVSLCISLVQTPLNFQKQRADERITRNPLIIIPPVPPGSDPSEVEEKSFASCVLDEFAKITLEYDGQDWKKNLTSQFMHSDVLKSSFFQHQFLQLVKNSTQSLLGNTFTPSEILLIFKTAIKIVDSLPTEYKIPNLGDGALPEENVWSPLTFNYKVQAEQLSLAAQFIRPSYEDQNDLIQRIEKRLVFEIDNLGREFKAHQDGEDISMDQDPKDCVLVIKCLFKLLVELVQRDREAIGMSRRIAETTIPQLIHQIMKFNTDEKGHLIDGFMLQYFSLIGKICADSPGSTPTLIKNGVLPSIYQTIKDRMPQEPDTFLHLIFLLSNATLQETGRQLAEDLDVYRHIIIQTVENAQTDNQNKYVSHRAHLFQLFDRNPLYKTQTAELVGNFITSCDTLVEIINRKYFEVQRNANLDSKDKAAKVANELLQSPEMKKFKTLLSMIANFTGSDERSTYDRQDRASSNRHVADIFPASQFKTLLQLDIKISKNPSLTYIHKIFQTMMRNLVDIGSFPANLPIFNEALEACSNELNKLIDHKLSKLEYFDFAPTVIYSLEESKFEQPVQNDDQSEPQPEEKSSFDEDQPTDMIVTESVPIITEKIEQQSSEFELTKQQHILGALTSLTLFSRKIINLHSQSVISIMLSTKIHPFILTVYNTMRVLRRMKVKDNSARVEKILSPEFVPQSEQDFSQQAQRATQSSYQQFSQDEKLTCDIKLGESGLSLNYKSLTECLGTSFDFQALEDILAKFIDFAYIVQRNISREQKEVQQTNQLFLGKLAFKFTQKFNRESLRKITLDNTTQCYETLLELYLTLKQLGKFSMKGIMSGACFFEVYKLGGLHNLIDLFTWLGSLLYAYQQKDHLYRQTFVLLEGLISELSTLIQRYIIQEEKEAQRIGNFLEVWQQSVFLLKEFTPFQNAKAFYQNVCYTLITEIFPGLDPAKSEYTSLKCLTIKGAPTGLIDTALLILTCANKNFLKCYCLSSGNGGQAANRAAERDDRRRPGGGAADPGSIQMLIDMFPEVTQRRATQYLQQARGSVEQAIEILMQHQLLGRLGINDEDILGDNQVEDVAMMAVALMSDDEDDTLGGTKQPKPNRVTVIQESLFVDSLKDLQKKSFSIIIELHEDLESTKCQYLLFECLLKKDLKEDQMHSMYESIDKIFTANVQRLIEQINTLKPMVQEDLDATENPALEQVKLLSKTICDTCTFASINQKILSINKFYLKAAVLHFNIPERAKNTAYLLQKVLEKSELELTFSKTQTGSLLQKALSEFLILLMSIVQMVHLKTQFYQSGIKKTTGQVDIERVKRRIAEYRRKVDSQGIFELSMNLSEVAATRKLKPQLVTLCLALCLRIIIDKESLKPDERSEDIHKLFEAFPKLTSYNSSLRSDPKIVQSVAVLNFETEEVVQQQIEKFLNKVLYAKYEWEISQREGEVDKGIEWTKTNMISFLSFFSQLSSKNQDYFKQIVKITHDAKAIKKGTQISQELATIQMKEGVFKEAKATITKERGILKKLVKTLDFKNDKSLSQQFKAAKKALLTQIPESSKNDLQLYMQAIIDHHQPRLDDFNAFIGATQAGTPYELTESANSALMTQPWRNTEIDTLATMLMAYPAYSVYILPQKGTSVSQKKSFIQWYIRDYLTIELVKRTMNFVEEDKPTEIKYTVLENSDVLDETIALQLNNLTGYHHLMTLNEQLIKHQLRSKFMLEALSVIQKVVKERNQPNINQVRQKALIKSALLVIESLIRPRPQMTHISPDNFVNSLRVCLVRDASHKDLNLPNGFLKLIDDLLTDIIDVSVPQNADFVNKCVSILKIIAEFVNKEKKKEDIKASPSKKMRSLSDLPESPRRPLAAEERKENAALEDSASEEERPDQVMHDEEVIAQGGNIDDVMAEEVDDDEDEMIEDDAGDDEDDDDEDDEEDLGGDHINIVEDEEMDDYGDDDDGSNDEPNAVVVMRRNAGPAQDIINFNNRGDPIQNQAIHWRIGERRERGPQNNIDWTEEEAQVQAILNGLRGSEPVEAGARAQLHHHAGGMFNQFGLDGIEDLMQYPRHRPGQFIGAPGAPEEMKKGLIKKIFEEFKIITEKELFDIVMRQKQFFDIIEVKEVVPKQVLPQRRDRLQLIRAELGDQLGALGGAGNAHFAHLQRIFGRVDEIDDLDALDNLMYGGNPLLMPRLGGGLGAELDNRLDAELIYGRQMIGGRPLQHQVDLNAFDERGYNAQLRATLAQPEQINDLLLSLDVQIEEEKKDESANPLQVPPPPRGFNFEHRPAENVPLSDAMDPLLTAFMNAMPSQPNAPEILPPRAAMGGLLGNVDRLSNLLQNLANPAPSQPLERVASPRLIIENPPADIQPRQQAPPTEIEQIRQSIQERSSQLQQNISENEQSLQDIIEGRGNNRQSHNQAAEGDLNVVEEIEEPLGSEGNINPPQFIGAPQQDQAAGVHQPASLPIQQPNISLEDVSAFEQEDSHHELPVVPQQPPQVEEVVQQLENIRIPEEEKKEEQPAQASGGRTFGYDNQYLIDNGIDPAILQELPEELRAELLSTIDIPPDFQPDQQQQPADNVPQNIEAPAQQPPAQPAAQPQQPEYYAIAQALGLDPEFLANLPEDMRMELIEQAQAQQAPPQRQPEQMDVASFVATVTDVNLRREIFMGMDEATITSLPPNLMAEARNVQNYIRQDRDRRQREALDRERQRLVDMAQQQPRGHFGRMEDIFGGHRHRGEQREANQRREKTLDEIVNLRNAQIADEISTEDIVLSINMQIINNEKIIEALLLILLTNDKAKCDLIPCLQALTKLQNQSGVPVIRNKVVNAITFLLKAIATNDVESLKLFLPNHDVKQKKSVLLLIGSLRLLLKSSKSLMKFILKGLVQRDDQGAGKAISSQILKKQFKALTLKSPIQASETNAHTTIAETTEIIQTSPQKQQQQKQVTPPSSLTEILSLIKTDYFKQDKMMLRNLSLLIQEILKKFDVAIEELESSNNSISAETIQSIADVLSLDTIDKNLLEALSDFFYQISLKKEENFKLVRDFCAGKSSFLLDKLNGRLLEISMVFQGAQKLTATRTLSMIERAMSHNSALEEEKSESMMIDGGGLALVATTSQKATVKLCEDDEKQLKQMMRISEDSDILFRIFKLLNHFYDKNSQVEQQQKEQQRLVDTTEQSRKVEQITRFVREAYENKSISDFASNVSEVLKIVQKTNFEVNESISNLIFCVFSAYYPELIDAIEHQRVQQIEEEKRKEQEPKEKTNKYQIKMLPLTEATVKATKEKFTLFKDCNYTSLRVEELSNFCMVNKRIINKMIKSRSHMFANELEGLIKHMPNILDFDNKRAHFKKELSKLKRNGYGGQIQLFIRRDDIFRDTYGQLKDKQADELKGRLHISFTGERGQDAGGLTRDFFIELSRAMFNPNYSLFVASSSGSSYYPNPKSYIESQHLQYFKFIGRIVGKAIFDECLLECYFVKSLYKIMTGEPLSITDLEDFDNAYYNNLKWCLENDVSILETTMSLEQDYFGKTEEIELVPNGKNIALTNENKWDYVEKVSKYRLYGAIQKQIDAFLEGFHELIPKELVSIFNFKELELLISGLPHFDLEDLKANTEFSGYSHSSPQVQWLWEVLEVFESAERAEFLQFVTGSSKVPVEGFKGLIGMRGPQKFTIAKIKTDDIMRLPSGHTCFNQLDLPEYPSKELLHERLLIAIKETKGFGFA